MSIQTDFRFDQIRSPLNIQRLLLARTDLLGPLRSFIGSHHSRTWSGPGFNMIWRPHKFHPEKNDPNTQDFFLEIDVTKETLSFTDITGPQGIANRGLVQDDIALGGLAYQQEVTAVTTVPNKPLHFEPGVWLNVPATTSPVEATTIARLGSIPHGTTIHAQGRGFSAANGQPITKPLFTPSSIMPFAIGAPDDGVTSIQPFPEGTAPLATTMPARTPLSELGNLTDAHFRDPSKILSDVANAQNIVGTTVFQITTNVAAPNATQSPNPGVPHEGGGIGNIAFLVGSNGKPNANVGQMTATFWVERVKDASGTVFLQLQYIQRVLLNFSGLSWPHVSVATMVVTAES